jgi:cytochrome b561
MKENYTRTAVALHWIVAALIAMALILGWYMTDMKTSPAKMRVYDWHKWIGVTVLALFFVRALWRMRHPAPPPVPMPAWQTFASHAVHGLLYVMLLVQPLTGWLFSNAAGHSIVYLGLVPLPDLLAKNPPLAHNLKELHEACAWVLVVIVGLHILAALKHHYVDHDDTLQRMLRWRAG